MSEWIDWNGGDCPVDGETLVDVKWECGSEKHPITTGLAKLFDWKHTYIYKIIAYRVSKEGVEA